MTLPAPDVADTPLEFGWNVGAGRYVDLGTGRFVSRDFVQRALEARFGEARATVQAYTEVLIAGETDIAGWQEAVMVELRRAHTQAAALGRGGWMQMTPSDWGQVGSTLKQEYGWLADFAAEIDTLSEAQIRARINQYADHLQQSFWAGVTSAQGEAGFTEERRVTTPAEHCADCLNYESLGWQPLGSLPEPGVGSVCGSNCHCVKEYR